MADITITAEHTYRHPFDDEMLEELARDIKQLDPSLEVDTGSIVQKDFQVDPHALITIYIPTVILYAGVLQKAVNRARKALGQGNNKPRPIQIVIVQINVAEPDSHVLGSVLVKDPVSEPEDTTEDTRQQPPPRRPR